jgi:hypothetical protein
LCGFVELAAPLAGSPKEVHLPRWLVILGIIALLAMMAGFLVFGGGDMGR